MIFILCVKIHFILKMGKIIYLLCSVSLKATQTPHPTTPRTPQAVLPSVPFKDE